MVSFEQEQRRQRRRNTAATTSVAVAVALQCLALLLVLVFCQAFQPQSPHGRIDSSISRRRRVSQLSTSSLQFYSDPEAPTAAAVTAPSFQQRMREQLRRRQSHAQQEKKQKINTSSNSKSPSKSTALLEEVQNLHEFKQALNEASHDGRMVSVFWYSPWCKACKAAAPGIKTLAKHHPNVKFIQVPVIEDNVLLHQGLNVPSVPYMHLYQPNPFVDPGQEPQQSLVEERKMTRKKVSGYQKLLTDYEHGACELTRHDAGWSTASPYTQVSTTPRALRVANDLRPSPGTSRNATTRDGVVGEAVTV